MCRAFSAAMGCYNRPYVSPSASRLTPPHTSIAQQPDFSALKEQISELQTQLADHNAVRRSRSGSLGHRISGGSLPDGTPPPGSPPEQPGAGRGTSHAEVRTALCCWLTPVVQLRLQRGMAWHSTRRAAKTARMLARGMPVWQGALAGGHLPQHYSCSCCYSSLPFLGCFLQ